MFGGPWSLRLLVDRLFNHGIIQFFLVEVRLFIRVVSFSNQTEHILLHTVEPDAYTFKLSFIN